MRQLLTIPLLAVLLVFGALGTSFSADEASAPQPTPEKVDIRNTTSANETRDYKVDMTIRDKVADPQSGSVVDWQAGVNWLIRHKYGSRQGADLLPMEISLTGGSISTGEQKLEIAPGLYPKLTVLFDRTYQINEIYGASGRSQSLPGINYGNLIMLFFVQAGGPRSIGEKWDYTVKLPSLDASYKFSNVITGVETVDGAKAARVRQEIVRVATDASQTVVPFMKATADSLFLIDAGKLLKSHVVCEAESGLETAGASASKPAQQEAAPPRANITLDVSLVK